METLRAVILQKQQEESMNELADQIDCFNVLSGQDED